MPQFCVWTIGCQMNKADSDYVAAYLERVGYSTTAFAENADFILINSCVVRNSAEEKVLNKLASLKGLKKRCPDVTIALTGCLVDSRIGDLKDRFPWVDLVFRPQQWEVLFQWAESRGLARQDKSDLVTPACASVSAFVPIIQGCNSFCSYCIVPYRRGKEKSRDPEEICYQARALVEQGTKEITLLGQNVGAYGKDLPHKVDLADLLSELNRIEGLLRIRFLTNHPRDMNRKLMQAIAELDKVCESISLPVQAGDDEVLKAMRRGYTADEYEDIVAQIRSTIPDIAMSTDVVVGFPNETDEQFQKTMDLLRRIRFDRVHTAAYSPRPGTISARKLADNVPAEEKQRRLRQAEDLHEAIAAEINAGLLGSVVEVLVEIEKKGKWQSRTRGDKLVFFADSTNLTGQLVKVAIEKSSAWSLQGSRADKATAANQRR